MKGHPLNNGAIGVLIVFSSNLHAPMGTQLSLVLQVSTDWESLAPETPDGFDDFLILADLGLLF